jgi:hypothetical protein
MLVFNRVGCATSNQLRHHQKMFGELDGPGPAHTKARIPGGQNEQSVGDFTLSAAKRLRCIALQKK